MLDNFLLDKLFLTQLDADREKNIYARIIALSWDEDAKEEISGMVTGGSINIDGESAVRRTCSLTLTADINDTIYHEANWGLNHKFSLEIGVSNNINTNYPDICWFKQGIFLTTSFSCQLNTTSYSINISGKDKMSLLNGDIGGKMPISSDDLSVLETTEAIYEAVKLNAATYLPGQYYFRDNNGYYKIDWSDNFDRNKTYYVESLKKEKKKLPLVQIIKNLIHTQGNEPYENIIINDLNEVGYELLEYRGEKELYLIRRITSPALYNNHMSVSEIMNYENFTFNKDMRCYKIHNPLRYSNLINDKGVLSKPIPAQDVEETTISQLTYQCLADSLADISVPGDRICFLDPRKNKSAIYTITKVEYGDAIGYSLIDLIYAGDLKISMGETVTSVLDKIKKQLVGYEYFYDLDGRFVFQKKSYSNEFGFVKQSLRKDIDSALVEVQEDASYGIAYEYNFQNNTLISAISNSSNLSNLKNDFIISGKRRTAQGVDIPIYMRVAFDIKPECYKTINLTEKQWADLKQHQPDIYNDIQTGAQYRQTHNLDYYNGWIFCTEEWIGKNFNFLTSEEQNKIFVCDWREIIYQMARDYYLYNRWEDFNNQIIANHVKFGLYQDGLTHYEQYYLDLYSFWRDIYNPDPEIKTTISDDKKNQNNLLINEDGVQSFWKIKSEDIITGANAVVKSCDFYLDRNKLDSNNMYKSNQYLSGVPMSENDQKELFLDNQEQVVGNKTQNDIYKYWNKNIFFKPYLLNFWFDFYNSEQYSVRAVGDRITTISNDKIKAIYYPEIPNLIFMTKAEYNKIPYHLRRSSAYRYFFLSEASKDLFSISSRATDAKESAANAINANSYITENITITSLPIYYLQPNCCINIYDEMTHINGLYNLTKITIPLTYNGTMSMTASKIMLQA